MLWRDYLLCLMLIIYIVFLANTLKAFDPNGKKYIKVLPVLEY